MNLSKFIISIILVTSIVLGLCFPVQAQSDTLSVESGGSRTIKVNVCSEFDVEIWIRGLTSQAVVVNFTIAYSTDYMVVVFGNTSPPSGWGASTSIPAAGQINYIASGSAFQDDHLYFTVTFHCLRPGSSPINVIDATYEDPAGQTHALTVLKAAVYQHDAGNPVGGFVTPTNKLNVLVSYLGLVGLVAAVTSAAVIIQRRKT